MLVGRFGNTSGAPYMAAHISIPRLNVHGSVSFLMDTGADQTVLMPVDAIRLGVNYALLTQEFTSYGVDGATRNYVEPAVLAVKDGVLHGYNINLLIFSPRADRMSTPSLLGRNVMNRWKLMIDFAGGKLTAKIRTSDSQTPIPKSGKA